MNASLPPATLTEKEAVAYTGFSRAFLARARMTGRTKSNTGGPPFIKIGACVRYRIEDLDRWLAAHVVER